MKDLDKTSYVLGYQIIRDRKSITTKEETIIDKNFDDKIIFINKNIHLVIKISVRHATKLSNFFCDKNYFCYKITSSII